MQVSDKGVAFIASHEGFVSKTYADPVGVPTIGYGFTNGSAAVRKHLGKVKYGMSISKAEAHRILIDVINEEYGPAAAKGMPGAKQHEFDMGCSGAFNVGARIFNWKWAQAFRRGDVASAANLWRTTATTARGKKLPGLVRRRKEEAALLLRGDYGHGAAPVFKEVKKEEAKPDPVLREYQMKLISLGYDLGRADGWMGPDTKGAVLAFQQDDPHLDDDGILGRATMQSIDRRLEQRKTNRTVSWTGVGGIVGTVSTWFAEPNFFTYVLFIAAVAIAGYLLWRNRHRLEAKFREIIS